MSTSVSMRMRALSTFAVRCSPAGPSTATSSTLPPSSSSASTSTSTSSTATSPVSVTARPASFRLNKRNFDSLSDKHAPDAEHHLLSDRPSVAFTIRTPASPAPPTFPASASSAASTQLPPRLRGESESSTSTFATLNETQKKELQALRLSDPAQWTRSKLAAKYNVSKFFVSTLGYGDSTEAKAAERKTAQVHTERQERRESRWGTKKVVDREVRRRRKAFW